MLEHLRQALISARKFGDDVVDLFKPKNRLEIIIRDKKSGDVIRTIKGRNVVTDFVSGQSFKSGKDVMRRLLINPGHTGSIQEEIATTTTGTWVAHMELGSGSVAEQASQYELATSFYSADNTAERPVSSTVTLNNTAPEVTWSATWGDTHANDHTISEAVLYSNKARPRDILARKTFTPFTKTDEFTVELRWTLRF